MKKKLLTVATAVALVFTANAIVTNTAVDAGIFSSLGKHFKTFTKAGATLLNNHLATAQDLLAKHGTRVLTTLVNKLPSQYQNVAQGLVGQAIAQGQKALANVAANATMAPARYADKDPVRYEDKEVNRVKNELTNVRDQAIQHVDKTAAHVEQNAAAGVDPKTIAETAPAAPAALTVE